MSFFFKKGDKLGSYEIDPNISIQSLAQNKSAVILMATGGVAPFSYPYPLSHPECLFALASISKRLWLISNYCLFASFENV